ncbi:EF-hand domain-containing protein [Pontibacter cellulosilyticus]|uniref:EF-hand domain-containing protein n=1 Tax=Pontibacter cellulosilyticus TaxID=1720253 RepID=A0A923N883_9BACT|nr:hypothetical protein [Pontibacter cellulosilyticus]MBC5992270.1 hypothetical protein [Pontibacter cellulosilyticus]
MKTIYLASLFLFSVSFMSCDGDNYDSTPVPISADTVAPQVNLFAPATNDSLLFIDVISVFADITDNVRVDNVRVVLTEPNGSTRSLSDVDVDPYIDARNYQFGMKYLIPKHAATGKYTVMVEAKDYGKNIAKDSATFYVYALDINSTAFAQPFTNALYNPIFSDAMHKLGFNYNDWFYGYSFDEPWLNTILYLMVNTDNGSDISEAEWSKFIADFDVQNQSWGKWDENGNGNLNIKEFQNGISSLKFFNDWDKNQNKEVYFDEMAAGIFTRWDLNKDNMLSTEEYQEKFYTYLYR